MSSGSEPFRPDGHPDVESEAPGADPIPLLKAVTALRQTTALYPYGHTIIQQSAAALFDLLQQRLTYVPSVRLDVIEGEAHLDGVAYRLESQSNPQVVHDFVETGIDSVHVERGVTVQELQVMAEVLVALKERTLPEAANAQLARRGVTHVTVGRLVALDTRWRTYDWPEEPLAVVDPAYADSLRLAREAFGTLGAGARPALGAVREILHLLISKVAQSQAALGQVLAIKEYENHTYCHSVNVAILSLLLARQVGLDASMQEALVEGALLHDVGKMRIPVEVIKKPGSLDARERELIERHPSLGASMLLELPAIGPFSAMMALEHHRHWKGNGGYPDFGSDEPHLLSQCVSVADVYEAMTGARAYRPPAPPEQACLVLARLAGKALNPLLVRAFVGVVTFFPVGTLVRTSRGERGQVVRTSERDPLHPVIVLLDDSGTPAGVELDTSERAADGSYLRHIVETLRPSVVERLEPTAAAR